MEHHYYHKFIRALQWGALESIGYELLLFLHQLALCKVTGFNLYGKSGAIIATIYLVARLLNFGFDLSIAPFFTLASSSKRHFKKILGIQLLIQLVIYSIAPVLLFLIPTLGNKLFLDNHDAYILFILAYIIIIVEGLQRSIKSILYFTFNNKKIAFTEINKIIIYISAVWTLYFFNHQLDTRHLLVPLLCCSLFSLFVFSKTLFEFYHSLPNNTDHIVPEHLLYRIAHTRLFTYIQQLFTQLYSSNFLIPIIALLFTTKQAGILTLASSINYFIVEIIRKTFGNSSSTLFSHIKHWEPEIKQRLFSKVTILLYITLSFIGVLLFLPIKKWIHFFALEYNFKEWVPAYIFLIIHFTEHFMIPYKKFFIVEEKSHQIMLFELVDCALIFLLLHLWLWHSSSWIITGLIIIRCLTTFLLAFYAYYLWKIYPNIRLMPYIYYLYPAAGISLTYIINFFMA